MIPSTHPHATTVLRVSWGERPHARHGLRHAANTMAGRCDPEPMDSGADAFLGRRSERNWTTSTGGSCQSFKRMLDSPAASSASASACRRAPSPTGFVVSRSPAPSLLTEPSSIPALLVRDGRDLASSPRHRATQEDRRGSFRDTRSRRVPASHRRRLLRHAHRFRIHRRTRRADRPIHAVGSDDHLDRLMRGRTRSVTGAVRPPPSGRRIP